MIDTHAHLYDLPDPLAALREAAAGGVTDVIVCGVDRASNERHLKIGTVPILENRDCPYFHLAVGLHPGNITTAEETESCFHLVEDQLRQWVVGRKEPRAGSSQLHAPCSIVAIGETGLDFWYKHVRRDEDKKREQRVVFERHLDLAKRHDLPIVIHSRGAWRECLEMTVASGVKKADFHWYSGPLDILKGILDAGFVISVTPALAYSEELKAAARLAPLEQILVETDTPVRGWTPKDVQTTVTLLAEVKGLPREEVARVVNATARGFFIIRDCP